MAAADFFDKCLLKPYHFRFLPRNVAAANGSIKATYNRLPSRSHTQRSEGDNSYAMVVKQDEQTCAPASGQLQPTGGADKGC